MSSNFSAQKFKKKKKKKKKKLNRGTSLVYNTPILSILPHDLSFYLTLLYPTLPYTPHLSCMHVCSVCVCLCLFLFWLIQGSTRDDIAAGDTLACMADAVENADAVLICVSKRYQDSRCCKKGKKHWSSACCDNCLIHFYKWLVLVCNIHNVIWILQTKSSHLSY